MSASNRLMPGTVLDDRYALERVVGQSATCISYLARDLREGAGVVLGEYYPVCLVRRGSDGSLSTSRSLRACERAYEAGLSTYVERVRLLARVGTRRAVSRPLDVFSANGTAYAVWEHVRGLSLAELARRKGGRLGCDDLLRMTEPLLDALAEMHVAALVHGGITPQGVVLSHGQARLVGWGLAIAADCRSYMPVEQSVRRDLCPWACGPWTDVYGLCATIYECLTGTSPPDALDRVVGDSLVPPRKLGVAMSVGREAALLKGLRVMPGARHESMAVLKATLYG